MVLGLCLGEVVDLLQTSNVVILLANSNSYLVEVGPWEGEEPLEEAGLLGEEQPLQL